MVFHQKYLAKVQAHNLDPIQYLIKRAENISARKLQPTYTRTNWLKGLVSHPKSQNKSYSKQELMELCLEKKIKDLILGTSIL